MQHHLLGHQVEDRITGFKGTVTGVVLYLTGCNQALVQPKVKKDGAVADSCWFDLQRLKVTTKGEPMVLDNAKTPGFDKEPPKR